VRLTANPWLRFHVPASEAGWVLCGSVLANLHWAIDIRGDHVATSWTTIGAYLRDSLPWAARHPDGPQ